MTMLPDQIKKIICDSNNSKTPVQVIDGKKLEDGDSKATRNNINMEAYQAYYNTNENTTAANEA